MMTWSALVKSRCHDSSFGVFYKGVEGSFVWNFAIIAGEIVQIDELQQSVRFSFAAQGTAV